MVRSQEMLMIKFDMSLGITYLRLKPPWGKWVNVIPLFGDALFQEGW